MPSAMVDIFNTTIPSGIAKDSDFYQAFVGKTDFVPEVEIVESEDYNCGAMCNELEFARTVASYYTACLDIDTAESGDLNDLVSALIYMPRISADTDAGHRKRFRFIISQKSNYRRTTRWAILDAIKYIIEDASKVSLIENFDDYNMYFEIRIVGAITTVGSVWTNDDYDNLAFIGHEFISGPGVGGASWTIADLIPRIKAAGVDFDVYIVEQGKETKTCDAFIGTVQKYISCDAVIFDSYQVTKTCDAVISV